MCGSLHIPHDRRKCKQASFSEIMWRRDLAESTKSHVSQDGAQQGDPHWVAEAEPVLTRLHFLSLSGEFSKRLAQSQQAPR